MMTREAFIRAVKTLKTDVELFWFSSSFKRHAHRIIEREIFLSGKAMSTIWRQRIASHLMTNDMKELIEKVDWSER